jgi:hypothetical protein
MIEALKLALVIEEFDKNDESLPMELLKPIAATLRAIAKLESQEPVAKLKTSNVLLRCHSCGYSDKLTMQIEYTHPPQQELVCVCGAVWEGQELVETPPQRTWVGLTEQQRNDIEDACEMIIGKPAFDAIEAQLKEENI